MSDMVASAGIPEVVMGTGTYESPSVPATFSGKWEDMASDLAAIAKEIGVPDKPAQPVEQPTQAAVTPKVEPLPAVAQQVKSAVVPQANAGDAVATPAAPADKAAAPVVEVPEKFRGADGKLDQEKLLKSYIEAEKALKRTQNAVNQPAVPSVPVNQAAPAQAATPANLSEFELQVARDLYNGGGYTEQQAISTARVQVRLMEAARVAASESALGQVSELREAHQEQRRIAELQSLAKSNPEVLTPQGYAELVRVREENPWINNSPEPWKSATLVLLGQKGMLSGQAGTVVIPNPTGAQSGQPLPVTPSQPAQTNSVRLDTPEQIAAYVKTLTPEQEGKFWKLQGYKWEVPKSDFKGL